MAMPDPEPKEANLMNQCLAVTLSPVSFSTASFALQSKEN